MSLSLIALGLLACIFVYSLLTNAIARSIITLPIVFMTLGFLCARPLEAVAEPQALAAGKRLIAEVTLILVLFSDASRVRFSQLRDNIALPSRMLMIGLPLSLAVGMTVAYLMNPASGIAMALLTAAVLSPTDAALSQAVASGPHVPDRLRQAINVEGGLNDGLILPFVLLGAILASADMGGAQTEGLARAAVLQLLLGPLVGVTFGWVFAKAMDAAQNRDLMAEAAGGVAFLSIAFAAYVGSEAIGGNGFIAAFFAGMVFGSTFKNEIHFIGEFMEGVGQVLTMLAFLIFGALFLPDALAHMNWKAVVLALLFLTIVRMLPVWLSLLGTGLPLREKLFLGWFGPRGLASILFAMILMDEFEFAGEQELVACVSMTVFLSIILHGITAAPMSKWIGKKSAQSDT